MSRPCFHNSYLSAAVTTRYYTFALLSAGFGGAYETTNGAWKKYYSFGGTTLMRDATGFKYFLSDHLGSVAVVLDDAGTILEQQRYLPFGEVRTDIETPPYRITSTDLTYTGQRNIAGTGLMDYNARFYSPYLNQFTQPDTIVPNLYNPQSLNRYSYVLNNPIRYNDPTGHKECEVTNCDSGISAGTAIGRELEKTYDIKVEGNWSQKEARVLRNALHKAAKHVGGADNLNKIIQNALHNNGKDEQTLTFSNRKVSRCGSSSGACWRYWESTISLSDEVFTDSYQLGLGSNRRPTSLGFNDPELGAEATIVHELGHVFADAQPSASYIYGANVVDPLAYAANRHPKNRYSAWEDSMATAFSLYVVTGGKNYPSGNPKQDQMDWVAEFQSLWTEPFVG